MSKKRVYVESSVISWLTANPPGDILKLAKQRQTRMWWDDRHRWDLFISPAVVREIRGGDPEAARKRLIIVDDLPLLPEPDETRELALALVAAGVVPQKALEDALHIAIATVCGMDYLVTWNQTHLFNPDTIEKLYAAIRKSGYAPSVLVRPDNLLEKKDGA